MTDDMDCHLHHHLLEVVLLNAAEADHPIRIAMEECDDLRAFLFGTEREYLSLSVAQNSQSKLRVTHLSPVRIRHTVADALTKVVVCHYVIGALRSRCGRRVIECDGAKVGAKIDDVMYSSYVALSQSQMRLAAHCKPTERER